MRILKMKESEKNFKEQFAKIFADAILSQVNKSVEAGMEVHSKLLEEKTGSIQNNVGEDNG
jgi:hypothetical protein